MITRALLIASAMVLTGLAQAEAVAPFDDFPLDPESHYAGEDMAGGFTTGGLFFWNAFHDEGSYSWWEGSAVSNETDTDTPGFMNQFSAYAGSGYESANFGVATWNNSIELPIPTQVQGMYLTNTTYAALSMLLGDFFVDPFGGLDGTVEDWFMVTITGKNAAGTVTGTVDYYLADYRFADPAEDYIVDDWQWVELTSLGDNVSRLEFSWDASQKDDWGVLVPQYVAIDNVTVAAIPEPASLMLLGLAGLALRRR